MLSNARLFQESMTQLDHDRLMSLINSISDGFLAVDERGLIELSNGVALDLLDTNSLDGKNIIDAMPLIDVSNDAISPLALLPAGGSNFTSRDYRLKYLDGDVINLYVNVSAVRGRFGSKDKSGYVVLFRDITKEKTAEQERDEFISVASHELRNPVAVAEGSLSNAILLTQKAQTQGAVPSLLSAAHEQIIFLGNLINDLAAISRADNAKVSELTEDFDSLEVVKSLQSDYAAQAQKKGLSLTLETNNAPKIHGSRLYTREILQNFVTNAIKYTEKGTITIKLSAQPSYVEISVQDTGIGIDKSDQTKLFSKFYRSEDTRVRKISGTGLGLYVSSKLAKLMNGSISMSSELNQGSSFSLRLPAVINGTVQNGATIPVA